MINKRSLWFLTLFSLILVLSVYYITMPSEMLLTNNGNYNKVSTTSKDSSKEPNNEPVVTITESSALVALRVEAEEQMLASMEEYRKVLNNQEASIDEKNAAFEAMKQLNIVRGEEEQIEKQILEQYKLKAFVKIDKDQIRIVVDSKNHDVVLANNIMRTAQSNYTNKMYISVKFQS